MGSTNKFVGGLLVVLSALLAFNPQFQAAAQDDNTMICITPDHPVAAWLVDKFSIDFEVLAGWYCDDGFGFGEIARALVITQLTDNVMPGDLLAMASSGLGWGEIVLALDLDIESLEMGRMATPGNGAQAGLMQQEQAQHHLAGLAPANQHAQDKVQDRSQQHTQALGGAYTQTQSQVHTQEGNHVQQQAQVQEHIQEHAAQTGGGPMAGHK